MYDGFAVDFGGGVLKQTALGVVEPAAEYHSVNIIGQQSLNIFAHVVGVRIAGLRANVKGCDALVPMLGQFRFDILGLTLGIVERAAGDWD